MAPQPRQKLISLRQEQDRISTLDRPARAERQLEEGFHGQLSVASGAGDEEGRGEGVDLVGVEGRVEGRGEGGFV